MSIGIKRRNCQHGYQLTLWTSEILQRMLYTLFVFDRKSCKINKQASGGSRVNSPKNFPDDCAWY